MISIELIDKMGGDTLVVNAARVSFEKRIETMGSADVKLLDYLARHGHTSPFRHPQISIRCTAPFFLARQLGKHQVGASWNEASRRYIDGMFDYHMPDRWRSRPDGSIKQGSGDSLPAGASDDADIVFSHAMTISRDAYSKLLELGVAPEQARMVIPMAANTEWVWTGSLYFFFEVWRQRSSEDAQWEARVFAAHLDDIIRPLFPHSWRALQDHLS